MSEEIVVLIAGIPGAMGIAVAESCLARGVRLAPFALAGPTRSGTVDIAGGAAAGGATVQLLPAHGEEAAKSIEALQLECAAAQPRRVLIAVDYSHPSAVNANGELFARLSIPFVMGTTGGDRDALTEVAIRAGEASVGQAGDSGGVFKAVIAANMCKQIVALQATMQHMATHFPGAFGGYTLSITESHQSTKADTSGTAKDMIRHFNALVGDASSPAFAVEDVKKLRDAEQQRAFGVPEAALKGHAYHTYALKSADGSVGFEFQHNVQGRRTYADGTVDAVVFLAARCTEAAGAGAEVQHVYDMIDVLRAGAMS